MEKNLLLYYFTAMTRGGTDNNEKTRKGPEYVSSDLCPSYHEPMGLSRKSGQIFMLWQAEK